MVHQKLTPTDNSPTLANSSPLTSRPFAVQDSPGQALTPQGVEIQEFNQTQFELLKLQQKAQSGAIQASEQESLGSLQTKVDDFWVQRKENASQFGHRLTDFSLRHPGTSGSRTLPIQAN